MRLAEPYLSKGRNITRDNFFTAKSLGENLKRESTSIVGTLEMSRWEVPASAKSPTVPLHSTTICKSGEMTLTSYQCKKNNVLLLSTIHNTVTINEQHQKKLPETVMFYNETKCGVDIVDQMSRLYTVKYRCRRWPMQVFFNVLDLAAINA
ncbi:hypothetical protein ANN_28009 [Periplaneta americana]|uniref:PiggyBac transposable element-derived protein domain-containing protein n=1 Tax=Periplaneta americana TaxID=6978 RepID=A0ABQ8RUI7_PERAM|nr:hypothetical protein ANN_28009 [Periplaneta americana]